MKKTIAIIFAVIITMTSMLCACTNKGDDTSATSTTTVQTTTEITIAETTTVETTTVETTTTKTTVKVKPTVPSVPEWCEEMEVNYSELPMELRGVTFKKAVFHKGTEATANELMKYGDDPYMHNRLYILVEGDSEGLEIYYKTQYPGNVNSTLFFEDEELVWRDGGLGSKQLNIFVSEGEATVSGFSPNLSKITNQSRMFQEFLELDGTFVKSVTFLFV